MTYPLPFAQKKNPVSGRCPWPDSFSVLWSPWPTPCPSSAFTARNLPPEPAGPVYSAAASYIRLVTTYNTWPLYSTLDQPESLL